jgi:hypothetical protein
MEHESLEYKRVMDEGTGSKVLARLAHLDIAGPAYRAAVLEYPQRAMVRASSSGTTARRRR